MPTWLQLQSLGSCTCHSVKELQIDHILQQGIIVLCVPFHNQIAKLTLCYYVFKQMIDLAEWLPPIQQQHNNKLNISKYLGDYFFLDSDVLHDAQIHSNDGCICPKCAGNLIGKLTNKLKFCSQWENQVPNQSAMVQSVQFDVRFRMSKCDYLKSSMDNPIFHISDLNGI